MLAEPSHAGRSRRLDGLCRRSDAGSILPDLDRLGRLLDRTKNHRWPPSCGTATGPTADAHTLSRIATGGVGAQPGAPTSVVQSGGGENRSTGHGTDDQRRADHEHSRPVTLRARRGRLNRRLHRLAHLGQRQRPREQQTCRTADYFVVSRDAINPVLGPNSCRDGPNARRAASPGTSSAARYRLRKRRRWFTRRSESFGLVERRSRLGRHRRATDT